MNYINTFLAVSAFSVFLPACENAKASKNITPSTGTVMVKIAELKKEKREIEIHTSGQFTTNDETYLSFKTGGVVNSVLVKEGDYVRRGQLLATLDLTEINTQVAHAKLGMKKAQRDYERVKNLYKDSVATLEQLENAKTGLDMAIQQYNAGTFNMNYSQIRAVTDGYILKKFVNAGQIVAGGTPAFQTNGAGSSEWILKAGLSDKEWAAVNVNDRAVIHTEILPGKDLAAVVVRKSEAADPVTGSFTADLKLVAGKNSAIAAGLFGKAQIFPSHKKEVWAVPYEAMLEGSGGKGYVFVTADSKTVKKVEVEIAELEKDRIFVSSGLENAQSLIVEGSPYLKENSVISVVK